jgi:uncharacterized membrane protein YidH (DUF202 family)
MYMGTAAEPPGNRPTKQSSDIGLYTKIAISVLVFCHSNTSKFIHKILLATDIAVVAIYTISAGRIAPVSPALALLVGVNVLFYVVPTIFRFQYSDIIDRDQYLPHNLDNVYMGWPLSRATSNGTASQRMWAKWTIAILGFPVALRALQPQLRDTAPEAAELISALLPAVPTLQRYAVTALIVVTLIRTPLVFVLFDGGRNWANLYSDYLSRV